MLVMRVALLAATLVGLAGCAGWAKSDASYDDFLHAYAACRYSTSSQATEGDKWREFGYNMAGVERDWPLCMKLHGWREVRSGERYKP